MKLRNFRILLLFMALSFLVSCGIENKNLPLDNYIINLFSSHGFNCKITEMEKSRSESFPYSGLARVIKIGEEEVFIFNYKDEKEVQHEVTQNLLKQNGAIYYNNGVILLYRGENSKIRSILEANFKLSLPSTPTQ